MKLIWHKCLLALILINSIFHMNVQSEVSNICFTTVCSVVIQCNTLMIFVWCLYVSDHFSLAFFTVNWTRFGFMKLQATAHQCDKCEKCNWNNNNSCYHVVMSKLAFAYLPCSYSFSILHINTQNNSSSPLVPYMHFSEKEIQKNYIFNKTCDLKSDI